MTKMEFAARVATLRKKLGLSQLEFAAQCDMHTGQIANLELGVGNPTLVTISKIATGLSISASDLLVPQEPVLLDYGKEVNQIVAYARMLDHDTQIDLIEIAKRIHDIHVRKRTIPEQECEQD